MVDRAGGSLTRVLSADVFAIVVNEIIGDSREMAFALEHDLVIVTQEEAIDQIETQLRVADQNRAPASATAVDDTSRQDATPIDPDPSPLIDLTSDHDGLVIDLTEPGESSNAASVPSAAVPHEAAVNEIEFDLDEMLAKQAPVADVTADDLVDDTAPEATVFVDDIPAGWYPVSGSSNDERYYDGSGWTDQFRSGGAADPLATPLAAFADEKNRWLAAVAAPALAVIIGSMGPWALLSTSVGDVSVSGIDLSGSLSLILAMAAGGAMAVGVAKGNRLARFSGVGGFAAAALLGLYEMTNLDAQITDSSFADASAGWGLWLVILGSLGGIALGAALARFDRAMPDRAMSDRAMPDQASG